MTVPVASLTDNFSQAWQALAFDVGAERYAIALKDVQEIRGYEPTQPHPTSARARGVIQVRGCTIPLWDLRVLAKCVSADMSPTTSVIVVRHEEHLAGLVVDSMCDVVTLSAGQLQHAPRLSSGVLERSIQGLASVNGRLVIVLQIEPYFQMAEAA